jgi:hypothetical protein
MGHPEWIAGLKRLHDLANQGALSPEQLEAYQSARDEFAQAMVAAQGLTLLPGQKPRHAFRVARALQIELALSSGTVRAMTQNISVGGFAALLAGAPPPTESIGFTLKTPGKGGPLLGRCKVVDVKARTGNALVSFAFEPLPPADFDRLDRVVLDVALEQLTGS